MDREVLKAWVRDARERTFDLVRDLDDEELFGPRIAIINPLHWEIGHVAWFQERWVMRTARKERSLRDDADALYDSSAIPHDDRWDLPLPTRAATLEYLRGARDRVLAVLEEPELTPEERYFITHTTFHEDMHDEAFTYTRHTLGYPAPRFTSPLPAAHAGAGTLEGDAKIPGGKFILGADPRTADFVFDNEKWGHEVVVEPFSIARAQVTRGEFLNYVLDAKAKPPRYWKRDADGTWLERRFDRWEKILDAPHRAMIHVDWYEAEAYASWAGRRLPTELEWEVAAAGQPDPQNPNQLSSKKRRYPWGDEAPRAEHANLDWRAMGTIDAGALPAGDSAFGVRQMIGNVWEWTSTDFLPYPGFVADPYKEYSEPWFGNHKVLRGGCWTTRARLIRNTWRNFYKPDRGDILAGFRTCAR